MWRASRVYHRTHANVDAVFASGDLAKKRSVGIANEGGGVVKQPDYIGRLLNRPVSNQQQQQQLLLSHTTKTNQSSKYSEWINQMLSRWPIMDKYVNDKFVDYNGGVVTD